MKFVVVMSTRNAVDLLPRTLASLDRSLHGHAWALVTSDDGSVDGTASLVQQLPSSAILRVHHQHVKAPTLSEAKNKAAAALEAVPPEFDLVLFMDDDDEMLPARVELARQLVAHGQDIAFGDLLVDTEGSPAVRAPGGRRLVHRRFSPCASVLRRRWVHANFWREVPGVLEDSYTFQQLRRQHDLAFCYHAVGPVHYYHRRSGSYSFHRSGQLKAETERQLASTRCWPKLAASGLSARTAQAWGLPLVPDGFKLADNAVLLAPLDMHQVVTAHPGRLLSGWSDELVLDGGLWWRGWPVDWLPASRELLAVLPRFDYLSVDERRRFAAVTELVKSACSTVTTT